MSDVHAPVRLSDMKESWVFCFCVSYELFLDVAFIVIFAKSFAKGPSE